MYEVTGERGAGLGGDHDTVAELAPAWVVTLRGAPGAPVGTVGVADTSTGVEA